jgi:hypothetical protein
MDSDFKKHFLGLQVNLRTVVICGLRSIDMQISERECREISTKDYKNGICQTSFMCKPDTSVHPKTFT